MAYRIGWQCFAEYEDAADYQMSQVVPAITADGKLQHPVKQGDKWTYAGQEVRPSFPQCNIKDEIENGTLIAFAIVGLMITAYCFKTLINFIHSGTDFNKGYDE